MKISVFSDKVECKNSKYKIIMNVSNSMIYFHEENKRHKRC